MTYCLALIKLGWLGSLTACDQKKTEESRHLVLWFKGSALCLISDEGWYAQVSGRSGAFKDRGGESWSYNFERAWAGTEAEGRKSSTSCGQDTRRDGGEGDGTLILSSVSY